MTSTIRSPWLRYGMAILAVVVATIVRFPLDPLWGDKYSFITFFITMVFVGWYSGLRPSLLALLLSTISARYFFTSPRYALLGLSYDNLLGLGFYVALSLIIALVMESQRLAQGRAESSVLDAIQKKQALAREVEERKWAEAEVRRLNEYLEQRILERTSQLQQSEQRFRMLATSAPVGIFRCDRAGKAVYFNPRGEQLLGMTAERAAQGAWIGLVHPGDRERVVPEWQAAVEAGTDFVCECRYCMEPERVIHAITQATAMRDQAGECAGFIGTVTDITERKQAEERTRLIVEASPSGLVLTDRYGRIVVLNRKTEEMFGYARDELIGRTVETLIPPRFRVRHPQLREGYLDHPVTRPMGAGRDLFGMRKDQSEFPVEIGLSPLETIEGRMVLASIVDITARKRAEDIIRDSEERFRLLVDGVRDYSIIMLDTGGRVVSWNQGAERLKGFGADEIVGRHFSRFYSREDVEGGKPERELTTALDHGRYEEEGWRVRKDGSRFLANVIITAVRDPSGELRGFSKVTCDITERKRAEERLQKQLARLHLINQITQAIAERQDLLSIYRVVLAQLEENLPVDFNAICSFDSHTNSLQVVAVGPKSQPLNAQMGMDEQAVFPVDTNGLGACIRGETVYDSDLTEVDTPIPRKLAQAGLRSLAAAPLGNGGKTSGILLTARRAVHGYSSGDCEFLKQLSSHVFLAAQHAQLYQELKTAYDDLRLSQKAVLQQERLRALGQMASGIAHDINNSISPIAIYSESLLESEPDLSPRARNYLTTIQQAIDDVAHTVSRMRDFYRQQERQVTLEPVHLNSLVPQVLDLTRARWRDEAQQRGITIDVKTDLAQHLPHIMGVESEIRDALTNLVLNAVDAMPQGGTLTILTFSGDRGDADGRSGSDRPTHVFLEVADSGTGMDEEIRQRCLEPFFTTKGDRGTGLGLAMVYGTMQRHSGDIEIRSDVDKGTRMRLLFPIPQGVIDEYARDERQPEPNRPLRLLVVDDDLLLRRSLQDALQADGHMVTAADGGQMGIEAFVATHQRGEPFEVVITDLGMPYVDGRAVAQAVKEKSPATAVILLTGWGQRMKTEGDIPPFVDRVLSKPPKLKDLRGALAELTGEGRTAHDRH